MRIEILGTGCSKCDALESVTRAAADKLGIRYELVHVTDMTEIVQRGVMMTPALVIGGQVKVSGRLPTESEITAFLTAAPANK